MNKLYVGTAIVLSALSFVNAQETAKKPLPPKPPIMRQGEDAPKMMTTGDASIDAQIKALNIEMEAKIKAIRDDYLAKIKAIVGEKKLTASSTRPAMSPPGMMQGEKRGMDEGNKMGRPFASTTDGTMQPPMKRGEVRGAEVENSGQVGNNFGPRVQNFFKGFFGN